jgi:5-formyltetrahydrofolate cyclo-ligase
MEQKTEIRKKTLDLRNSLAPEVRALKGHAISRSLENTELFQDADHILFYYAFGSEVDTIPLINKWITEKKIYLPKLDAEGNLMALPFTGFETMTQNNYHIPEPLEHAGTRRFEKKLDLIIVPGVAFDPAGNRIGMGKGYYDRYLGANKTVPRIALCYSEQVLDEVPKADYDETVDLIITDQKIYTAPNRK